MSTAMNDSFLATGFGDVDSRNDATAFTSCLTYDNDWGSFGISGSDRATTEAVERYCINSFVNPWIGRYLKRYFLEAGLTGISVHPSVSVIDSFELADQVYNLRQTADRLVEAGEVSPDSAAAWRDDLEQQSAAGCFLCSLTAYTVVGKT